jgi:hypothetical protein
MELCSNEKKPFGLRSWRKKLHGSFAVGYWQKPMASHWRNAAFYSQQSVHFQISNLQGGVPLSGEGVLS